MHIDISAIIILMGIIQGYFLAFILFSNRNGNYQANRYLGLLLCSFSTSIVNIFLLKINLYKVLLYTSKMSVIILYFFGPLLLFYVHSLVDQTFRLRYPDWLHFLPALMVFAYYTPYYLAEGPDKYAFFLIPAGIKFFRYAHYEFFVLSISAQIHLWIYLLVVHRFVKQYHRSIKDFYSNIEQHNLRWIQFFLSCFEVVYIIIFFLCIVLLVVNYMVSFILVGITVSIGIFILGYRGLKQTEIFTLESSLKKTKYESSELPRKLVQSLIVKLKILMEEDKLFTITELNLDDLAKKLSVSKIILSQYIRDYLKTNFFDYINRLRVEEMKRLLLDPEKQYMTIVALANEAGFNAKSTSSRIFKQFTGMTPSAFRKDNCCKDKRDSVSF
ncbi:MAG: helix-turn-helix transcriptional regulator [Firmicutes bacterium]|nr:helix-turn-helix transcriptional regulator [Bacillota bacterium]